MDQRREAMQVRDVMTHAVDFIAAGKTVREAARKMQRLGMTGLTVVANREAIGMITDRDIVLRVVAPGLDPGDTAVAAVMTPGLVVCREEDSLGIAARMMARSHLYRLVVINRRGELSGIVSIGALWPGNDIEGIDPVSAGHPGLSPSYQKAMSLSGPPNVH
jgi:CBS domain-containing protein